MNTPLHLRLLTWFAKTLGAFVLLIATLWTGLYFVLGSGPGREALAAMVRAEAPGLEPTMLRWGPAPDRLLVGGIEVRDLERPMAALTMASLDLGLWSLLGRDPTIERLRIELSYLHANIGPDGRVDLLMVLAPPRVSSAGAPKRPKTQPRLRIESLEVRVGELLVTTGADGVHARDVALSGAVSLGDRVDIALSARTGEIHTSTDRGRRSWMAGALELDGFKLEGPVGVDRQAGESDPSASFADLDLAFALRATRESAMVWRVDADKKPGLPAQLRVDADLNAADAATFFSGADLPHGVEVGGLVLELVEAPSKPETTPDDSPPGGVGAPRAFTVRGRLDHLLVPELLAGELAVRDLRVSLAHFDLDPQRLIPQVEVTVGHLQAAYVAQTHLPEEGVAGSPAWTLEGLDFGGGRIALLKRLELHLWPGHVQAVTVGGAEPFAGELGLEADLGLTGGPINAHLTGASGGLFARGRYRLSPLTGKSSFGAEVIFTDLIGAPARALLSELPPDHPLLGAEAPAATGTMTLELENGDEGPEVVFDEGLVTWSGGRWRWDGYAWADDMAAPPGTTP